MLIASSYTESMEALVRDLEKELVDSRHKQGELEEALRRQNDGADRVISSKAAGSSAKLIKPGSPASKGNPTRTAAESKDGQIHRGPVSRELGRMVRPHTNVENFVGSSSGVFFLDTAFAYFKAHVDPQCNLDAQVEQSFSSVWRKSPAPDIPLTPLSSTSQVLPPYDSALSFISVFFDQATHMFPVLHKPTFLKSVQQIYEIPLSTHLTSFLPQLYMVLAVGAQYQALKSGDEAASTMVGRFYRIAKDSQYPRGAHEDLMLLQDMVLELILLEAWDRPSEAAKLCRETTALVLQLGLHRHSRRFRYGPLETEMRKRIFWCVYIIDVCTALTLGLPKSLRDPDIDVDYPSDVDDDSLTETNYLPVLPGEPTRISTFISLCKLSSIMSQTVEMLYTTTDRRGGPAKIIHLTRLLDAWEASSLQEDTSAEDALGFESQHGAVYPPAELHKKILLNYIRWIVHRPALSFGITEPQYSASLHQCTQAVVNLIRDIRAAVHLLNRIPINTIIKCHTVWLAGIAVLFRLWLHHGKQCCRSEYHDRLRFETEASCKQCIEILQHFSTSLEKDTSAHTSSLSGLMQSSFAAFDSTRPQGQYESSNRQPGTTKPIMDGIPVCTATTETTNTLAEPPPNPASRTPMTSNGFEIELLQPGLMDSFNMSPYPELPFLTHEWNLQAGDPWGDDWASLGLPLGPTAESPNALDGAVTETTAGKKRSAAVFESDWSGIS
ncbi:MAG: hypothetical protein M1819_001059 [Sarea resinae]|nr:MAG: hypothetical protein M1819_001059 [Sarea resinae]